MTYFIRLHYGFHVQADSKGEAFRKAVKAIKEKPEMVISAVGDEFKKEKSILKRLFFGN